MMTLNEAIAHIEKDLTDENHDWGCEECRQDHEQLLEWLKENAELKMLLKLAVSVLEEVGCGVPCIYCERFTKHECGTRSFKWIHADEAAKLLGEVT